MLTISRVFSIVCLLCLCGKREYPGSFQNKSVSSSFKCVSKWSERERLFEVASIVYPLNYLLHMEVMLRMIKDFIILFLLSMWEQGTPWQFSKQINKLSFHFNWVSRYILFLAKLKVEEKPFLEGWKKGDHIVTLSPRALACHKRWKSLSFLWNLKQTYPSFNFY